VGEIPRSPQTVLPVTSRSQCTAMRWLSGKKKSHLCHQKLKHPLFSFEEAASPPSPLTSLALDLQGTEAPAARREERATEPHSTVSVL